MKKRHRSRTLLSLGMAFSLALLGSGSPTMASAAMTKHSADASLLLDRLGLSERSDKLKTAAQKKGQPSSAFSNDELVIKYRHPLSAQEHQQAGGKLVKRIASLRYDVVKLTGKTNVKEAMRRYAENRHVVSVSRSARFVPFSAPVNDPKKVNAYYLTTLQVERALSLAGPHPVKVAVVDTGIDANHPELKGKIIANYNVMNPLQKGAVDVHGTHVAGIITGEKDNGIGAHGVFPRAQIISIDVFNRSFFSSDYIVAEGILEAIRQKAQVINLSLGSSVPSPIVEEAVQKALAANITVVAATGNSGTSMYEYPAAYEGVIGVGAVNADRELTDFSTYGPSVDVVAPGENIYSSVYDVDKQSTFAELSGTSMATPMVTATVAMLLSKNPKLTPYDIHYILNETASDLGRKGYDLQYGHGLVNPVAALWFNPKNVPPLPSIAEQEILKKAKRLDMTRATTQTGTITKLGETHWYALPVQKGEYVQVRVNGTADYDYKFDILFFQNGQSSASTRLSVNDTVQGKEEGNLFTAPEDGTVAIGVKDALGNYHENGASKYTLFVSRETSALDDGNTAEQPFVIRSLPYRSLQEHGPLFFTNEQLGNSSDQPTTEETDSGDEQSDGNDQGGNATSLPGDSDYFSFSLPDSVPSSEQTVRISLTGVAGIDSALNLYIVEPQVPSPENGEEMPNPSDGAISTPEANPAMSPWPIDSANMNGYGEGEELIFNAVPGMQYIVEVTNKPVRDPFMLSLTNELGIDLTRNFSSHLPYGLTVDAVTLPADEDGFPMTGEQLEESLKTGTIEEYMKKKEEWQQRWQQAASGIVVFDGDDDWSEAVRKAAKPYESGQTASGYFQYGGDEDWLAFTPKQDGIYEFRFAADEQHDVPLATLFVYDEKEKTFTYIGSNAGYDLFTFEPNARYPVGLKKGTTYYIQLNEKMYRPSVKAYAMTSVLLAGNVNDRFENNDDFDHATPIGLKAITGNFASAQDIDTYYFRPDKNGLYGLAVTPASIPSKYASLPSELRMPIDPILLIVEDTNKNKKLDPEEEGRLWIIDNGLSNDEERGALRAEKTKGYFIVTADFYGNTTVTPYVFSLALADQQDEDRHSTVRHNVPSKPLSLRTPKQGTWYNTGYMNVSSSQGDVDYYKLTARETATYTIQLRVPSDLDGVVTVYNANGKLIAKGDYYTKGDNEYLTIKLSKGNYFIKVEDAFGNASVSPYKLVIQQR
ncbi:S8 family serine peptidase [Geobacillus subterraneus]|uniref:S8 family serine peptidase n=1 Tax=Geobacillus subterraneus TaxID=129338 RepID=UPI002AC89DE5|nr:S8 family serine peptidase [Geobacillus subterraneus]WPZ18139.1 S8 family serine peptidase [Geobacillus subterraneus]